jgi:glycosyltransferase involved in cell wall biosynthesis
VEENIVDGVSGMLLPVDCAPDDISEKLVRLRDDPEYRAFVGGKAREAVLDKWTWGRVANSYVDAFREVRGLPHRSGRRVGFLWWYNPYTTTETSVLTIQRKALEEMGAEVETFNIETVFTREEELRRLNDVDLVFTGVVPLVLEDERLKLIKSPVYFNIDGYGGSTFHDGYFNPQFPKLTEKASLVTFLDMNVAEEFKASGLAFDWDKLFWMPNGAEDLKAEVTNPNEFRQPNEVHVGSLMKDNEYKKPWIYLEAANKLGRKARFTYPILTWKAFLHDYGELGWPRGAFGLPTLLEYEDGYVDRSEGGKPFGREHGDILRVTRARLQGLPEVDFLQHMPYRKVPNYVSGCDVFCHYSHGDAFAKTVTEAFSLGKAPICSDIIWVQGIAEKHLGEAKASIGQPMLEAYGKLKPLMGTGRHLVVVPRGRSDLCAEAIRWALDNGAEYDARGEAARSWSLAWVSWSEKWRRIFELAEARKVI